MVTVRNATPQDGQPDTQWGFNDIALTFSRDAQGHLPTRAGEVNAIFNSDGDPNSGLDHTIIASSHGSAPTDAEIEERLPFRLNPEDQLIRYNVPGTNDSYVVVRRPTFTDRCEANLPESMGNGFDMTPPLANALAATTRTVNRRFGNPMSWCADFGDEGTRSNGRLRVMTPFHLDGDHRTEVTALRDGLDRIERAHANPQGEPSIRIRTAAAAVSTEDISQLRTQINEALGVSRRIGLFIDENPILSAGVGLITALGLAVGGGILAGYSMPFGSHLGEAHYQRLTSWMNRRRGGGTNNGGGSSGGPQGVSGSGGGGVTHEPGSGQWLGMGATPTADAVAGVHAEPVDASVEGPIDTSALPSESEQIRRFGPEVRQRPSAPQPQPTGATVPSQSGLNYLDYGVLGLAAVTTALVTGPTLLAYLGLSGEVTATAGTVSTVAEASTAGAELTAGLTTEQALLLRVGEAFTTANTAAFTALGGAAFEGVRRAAPVVQRVVENVLSH